MALFGSKKKTTKTAEAKASASLAPSKRDVAHVLRHARITEKASVMQSASIYTFNVATSATKRDVIEAVRNLYKVTPVSVRMVTVPSKNTRSMRTGKRGVKSGGKKAYVYLKRGETITIA